MLRPVPDRVARARRFLMCPPTFFDVRYAINPWMDPADPPDPAAAEDQWSRLYELLVSLGHQVELVEPVPGLPDMVFAANAATVIDGRVLVAKFRHPQRGPEAVAYEAWFRAQGYEVMERARCCNEGQGDHLLTGGLLLAGHGFRTDPAAHVEAEAFLRRPVVPLTLVDPRFYHLDTALAALADGEVMYYPQAFSSAAASRLTALFPDAVHARETEAAAFALNAICDGLNVVLPSGAARLDAPLRARGYKPHFVEVSELMKAGGGPKCCVLELHQDDATHPGPGAEVAAA
ncbi:dimethylargininase [Streptacidiphilus melanogenes]|uniref:dimethylargininase n=1 Tax=Streptacidiphilus melanogenes TaxID=411235 RepID=UPI0005AA2336|nr:dimethylargininase [Streptacidiphilus melanogenes]